MIKHTLTLLLVATLLSGCTTTLLTKPGAQSLRVGKDYQKKQIHKKAESQLLAAAESAIDHETKSRALAGLGDLYANGYIDGKSSQDAMPLFKQSAMMGNHSAFLQMSEALLASGNKSQIDQAYQELQPYTNTSPEAAIAAAELSGKGQKSAKYIQQAVNMVNASPRPRTTAMQHIAKHYAEGKLVPKNMEQAKSWYSRAMDAGSQSSIMELANLLEAQEPQPAATLVDLWQRASTNTNNATAIRKLGFAYELGWGVSRDSDKGEKLLERASQLDNAQAYKIARRFEGLSKEQPEYKHHTAYWFQTAANLGDSNGMYRLARMYWNGDHVEQNIDWARQLYQSAATAGNQKAAEELAKYEARLQKAIKKAEKRKEEKRLAELKRKQAKAKTKTTAKVEKTSQTTSYKASTENAETKELLNMAKKYSIGIDTNIDLKKAYGYYQQAAQLGNAEAEYQLGLGYARGIGVEKNERLAKKWLTSASEKGYVLADEIYQTMSAQ